MIDIEELKPRAIAAQLSLPQNQGDLIKFFKRDEPFDEEVFDESKRHVIGFQLNLSGRVFKRLNLRNANLHMLNLSGAKFDECNFSGAHLSSNLYDTVFKHCKLIGARLTNTKLLRTKFIGCDLTNADVGSGTKFIAVDMTGSDIKGIKNFTQVQYHGIRKGAITMKHIPTDIVLSKDEFRPAKKTTAKTKATEKYRPQSLWEKIFGRWWPPRRLQEA
jgi:uncharacterized protein YjbI with pentapeptide repeats